MDLQDWQAEQRVGFRLLNLSCRLHSTVSSTRRAMGCGGSKVVVVTYNLFWWCVSDEYKTCSQFKGNKGFQELFHTELTTHVHVGPLPIGIMTPLALPLKEINPNSPAIKHFLDIIYDVDPNRVNVDNLKAIIRNQAWSELPDVKQMASRPTFDYVSQYFLLPQVDEKVCLLEHFYIKDDKIKGQYVERLVKGQGFEISWQGVNKHKARRGFQYMLEQLGGSRPPANEEDQDAGWDFIIQHGERDKGNLKQLRWIHRNVNRDGSPIHGWNEKLVQRVLDSLANDGTMAAVISRYDLTIDALEPDVLEIIEKVVPHLRGHALWLLGEPGVGKTPLGRMLAMMFSRFHGGTGTFRSASGFDFFRGVFFGKTCPALYDDGEVGGSSFGRFHLAHKLVKPALGYIAAADARAILKRAVFMVFTKEFIYYRFPTEKEVDVKCLKIHQNAEPMDLVGFQDSTPFTYRMQPKFHSVSDGPASPATRARVICKSEYLDWEQKVIDAFYSPSQRLTDLMPVNGKPAVLVKRKIILYVLEAGGATAEMVAACSSELPSEKKLTMFHRGSQSLDSVSHGLQGAAFVHPACDLGGLTNYKQMLGKEAEHQGEVLEVRKTSQLADCAKLVFQQWAELAGKEFPGSFETDLKAWLVSALMAFQTGIQLRFLVLPNEHRVVATAEDVRVRTGKYFTRCFRGSAEEYAEQYFGSELFCGISSSYITPNLNKHNLYNEYAAYKPSDSMTDT
eukprot:s1793_g9.t3